MNFAALAGVAALERPCDYSHATPIFLVQELSAATPNAPSSTSPGRFLFTRSSARTSTLTTCALRCMGSSVEQREADGDRSAGDHRGTRAEKRWQLKRCGCAAGSMLQRTILRQKVTTRTGLRARS